MVTLVLVPAPACADVLCQCLSPAPQSVVRRRLPVRAHLLRLRVAGPQRQGRRGGHVSYTAAPRTLQSVV